MRVISIFDIFTGKSAKDAAAKNTAEYNKYKTEGLGDLDTGFAGAKPAVENAIEAYTPISELGAKYGRGTDLYMDALGINGGAGTTRATGSFQTSPGYRFMVDEAVDRGTRAAARFSPGGNEIDAVTRLGSNLANQEWGNWLTRLGGFIPQEQGAMTTAAGGRAAGFGAMAGLHSTDALNRVNLRGNVAGGIANSNTAAAKAQMDASSAFWNGLMSLGGNAAKAATGGGKPA